MQIETQFIILKTKKSIEHYSNLFEQINKNNYKSFMEIKSINKETNEITLLSQDYSVKYTKLDEQIQLLLRDEIVNMIVNQKGEDAIGFTQKVNQEEKFIDIFQDYEFDFLEPNSYLTSEWERLISEEELENKFFNKFFYSFSIVRQDEVSKEYKSFRKSWIEKNISFNIQNKNFLEAIKLLKENKNLVEFEDKEILDLYDLAI